MAAVMYDERNPPPVDSLDALNASIGPTNGAMEEPRGPGDYGRPEAEIPPGHMLTSEGIVPCIPEADGHAKVGMSTFEYPKFRLDAQLLRDLYGSIPFTLGDWEARQIPLRDFLLGWMFTTTSRAVLAALTGLGKSHLALAIGIAMAGGNAFCHWQARREARVLIVDGEMSRELPPNPWSYRYWEWVR